MIIPTVRKPPGSTCLAKASPSLFARSELAPETAKMRQLGFEIYLFVGLFFVLLYNFILERKDNSIREIKGGAEQKGGGGEHAAFFPHDLPFICFFKVT